MLFGKNAERNFVMNGIYLDNVCVNCYNIHKNNSLKLLYVVLYQKEVILDDDVNKRRFMCDRRTFYR